MHEFRAHAAACAVYRLQRDSGNDEYAAPDGALVG